VGHHLLFIAEKRAAMRGSRAARLGRDGERQRFAGPEGVVEMPPLYQDPGFTFRFADDRIIPRFHLEGVPAGQTVAVFQIDPGTGEQLALLATTTVGEGGWVDLAEPIMVKAGGAFVAVPG
jgi:hypothetical protein